MFGREASLVRRCVPFKFRVAGPVAAVAQRTFERYPHTFTMALEALEELDTTPVPKMMMAEALQALAIGTVDQNTVRELFQRAEHAARGESNGGEDHDRWVYDPEYRLNTIQLHMAAGWWERLFRPHSTPWSEAEVFIHLRYASDVRRDTVISKYCEMVLTRKERGQIQDHIDKLYEQLILLERDLYGKYRFDRRSDAVYLFQSIKMAEIGKTPESAAALVLGEVKAIERVGNFHIDTFDEQDRWVKFTVSCKPEDDPAPWEKLIEVPEMQQVYNPNIPRLCPAGRPLPLRRVRRSDEATALGMEGTERVPLEVGVAGLHRQLPNAQAGAAAASSKGVAVATGSSGSDNALATTDGGVDVEVPGALAALVGSQTAGAIARVAPEGWITLSHDDIADRGFVRVYFDDHLIPRRDVRDELSYAFELAQIRPEVGMFPRKIGEIWGL